MRVLLMCVRSRLYDGDVGGSSSSARGAGVRADGPRRLVQAARCKAEPVGRAEIC